MEKVFYPTQSGPLIQDIINQAAPLATSGDMTSWGYGYGVCSTAGATAAKTLSLTNYSLKPGGIVSVLFQNAFTASDPTLNINSLGAKPIKLFGLPIAPGKVHANTILVMNYDGTNFNVIAIQSQAAQSTQDAVDLGLPSGLLWCNHNVGASRPEEQGLYFSWGNPTGHAAGSGYYFTDEVYAETAGAALSGNISVGDTYDMVHHNMGGQWRLPRSSEFKELVDNCDHEWIDEDGVQGMRFTSRVNGNSIFFPASGMYDGNSLDGYGFSGYYFSSDYASLTDAKCLLLYADSIYPQYSDRRYYGFTVRGVQ